VRRNYYRDEHPEIPPVPWMFSGRQRVDWSPFAALSSPAAAPIVASPSVVVAPQSPGVGSSIVRRSASPAGAVLVAPSSPVLVAPLVRAVSSVPGLVRSLLIVLSWQPSRAPTPWSVVCDDDVGEHSAPVAP
jgi:hypothetical protein